MNQEKLIDKFKRFGGVELDQNYVPYLKEEILPRILPKIGGGVLSLAGLSVVTSSVALTITQTNCLATPTMPLPALQIQGASGNAGIFVGSIPQVTGLATLANAQTSLQIAGTQIGQAYGYNNSASSGSAGQFTTFGLVPFNSGPLTFACAASSGTATATATPTVPLISFVLLA